MPPSSATGANVVLAEMWNGSSWKVQQIPNPAQSAGGAQLNGVSCTSPTACVAVGEATNATGATSAAAERWDGRAWKLTAFPTPASAITDSLAAVSCRSAVCIAVGSSRSSTVTAPLSGVWNGSRWSLPAVKVPRGAASGTLNGVSCTSPTACSVVGDYVTSAFKTLTLALSWNGRAWTTLSTPDPAGTSTAQLAAVSCSSTHECVASGSYNSKSGSSLTLAEVLSQGAWKIVASANPKGFFSYFTGISCSISSCEAVGPWRDGSGNLAFVESWNGRSWKTQVTPPQEAAGNLASVSCPSTQACSAVGTYARLGQFGADGQLPVDLTLVETWSGKAWVVQKTPNPTGSVSSVFLGVSCAAARDCVAVGLYLPNRFSQTALGEIERAGSWKLETIPIPVGTRSSNLFGVSCTSPSACTAVGSYFNSTSLQEGLAVRWNGSSWVSEKLPSGTGKLSAVSCVSARECTAVGTYQNQMAAESWNGSTWKVKILLRPAAVVNGSQVLGISCTSGSACEAVGDYRNRLGTPSPIAESWNGRAWRLQNVPSPPVAPGGGDLVSVSCTSASMCRAGGSYSTTNLQATLAEFWNGSSWTVQKTVNPSTFQQLLGISCRTASWCETVGTHAASPGTSRTQIEATR